MIDNAHFTLTTTWERSWLKEGVVVVAASFLIALFAMISIPLPFTPVPLATQPQVVLFLAMALGRKRAVAAVLLYLIQGAMGLPVFAGGVGGVLILMGPTGGYLLGYLVAAFVTGWISDRLKERSSLKTLAAMAVGNGVIFLFGAIWLSQFIGWQGAWMLGILPFLLGDGMKLLIATRALKACR